MRQDPPVPASGLDESGEDADYDPSKRSPSDSSIASMSDISSEHFIIANQHEAEAAADALPL